MINMDRLSLHYRELTAVKEIVELLTGKYSFIKKIILYGSKARGDFIEDSDIDMLFLLNDDIPRSLKREMYDIIYDKELSNDVVVTAILIPEKDFQGKINPFFKAVKREGITLWKKE